MNYRYHSVRCRHGFCLATVGCEQCGVKAKRGAAYHLRRQEPGNRVRTSTRVPGGYDNADGKRQNEGNSNARSSKW